MQDDLSQQFSKAMIFFDKEKYVQAKEEFDFIIMIDPGSQIANESQFYKAESHFQMKEYDEAWKAFDRFVRFTNDIKKIEKARYRLCECAIFSSNKYPRDQKDTYRALDQLQMFIDDFPESGFVKESEEAIEKLRFKLAQKEYEVGKLYIKLEEYESAIIYFNSVLNSFYDTDMADNARNGIIITHILIIN